MALKEGGKSKSAGEIAKDAGFETWAAQQYEADELRSMDETELQTAYSAFKLKEKVTNEAKKFFQESVTKSTKAEGYEGIVLPKEALADIEAEIERLAKEEPEALLQLSAQLKEAGDLARNVKAKERIFEQKAKAFKGDVQGLVDAHNRDATALNKQRGFFKGMWRKTAGRFKGSDEYNAADPNARLSNEGYKKLKSQLIESTKSLGSVAEAKLLKEQIQADFEGKRDGVIGQIGVSEATYQKIAKAQQRELNKLLKKGTIDDLETAKRRYKALKEQQAINMDDVDIDIDQVDQEIQDQVKVELEAAVKNSKNYGELDAALKKFFTKNELGGLNTDEAKAFLADALIDIRDNKLDTMIGNGKNKKERVNRRILQINSLIMEYAQ